jgi:hypothetical protein
MRAVDAFLLSLDQAWTHRWESLSAVLDGIHPEEAEWQAPVYGDAEHEDGWPLAGSIHWQVAHVAHCKRAYTEYILQRDRPGRPPAPPRPRDTTWDEEVAGLKRAHARQRDAIASLTDADLGGRVGNGMTLAEFLAMCVRHDVWHASQIAVARRLYRNRR